MTACLLLLAAVAADPLGPGNHERKLTVDGRERSYLIHIPAKYDAAQKTPVVLVLHGAGMNAAMMVGFSGMNKKSDEAGFIAAYPNGTATRIGWLVPLYLTGMIIPSEPTVWPVIW